MNENLKSAQDVALLLLSNIMVVLFILFAIFMIMYHYSDIKNSLDFLSYLKHNFVHKNTKSTSPTKDVSLNIPAPKEPEKPPIPGNPLSALNYANMIQGLNRENVYSSVQQLFQNQLYHFFKFPFLLFVLTIFYIILFDQGNETFQRNAHIITPFLLLVYGYVLYKSYFYSYFEIKRGTFNKMKSIILLFCILATVINLYIHDPGNFIQKHFAQSMIFIILISLLTIMYTGFELWHGWKFKTAGGQQGGGMPSFMESPSFQMWNFILNVIFFLSMVIVTAHYHKTKNKRYTQFLIATIILSLGWFLFSCYLFFQQNSIEPVNTQLPSPEMLKNVKLILLLLIIITCTSFVIYFVSEQSSQFTTTGKICIAILICLILSVVYKYLKAKYNLQQNKLYSVSQLLLNFVFFIPCLLFNSFDYVYQIIRFLITGKKTPVFNIFNETDYMSLGITASIAIITILYIGLKQANNRIVTQNGKVLINQPVYLNKIHYLGSFAELNLSEKNVYHNYAVSFWVFMHSTPEDRKLVSSSEDY